MAQQSSETNIFGVNKPGGILINFYSTAQKGLIIGACQFVDKPFVWDVGGENPHVNAALGRGGQGGEHFVVQDQIRGCDVDVVIGRLIIWR